MPTSDDDVEDFVSFYEVEAVVGQRKKKGRKEYLIKWKGYASDQNTWEPIANLNKSAREEARAYNSQVSTKGKSPSKRPRLDSSGDDIVVKKEQSCLSEEKKKIAQDADTPGKEHTADDDSPTNQNGKDDDGATKVASAAAIKREFQADTDDESPPVTDKLDSQVKLKQEYLADTDDDDDGGDDEVGNKEQLTTTKRLDTPEGAKQLKEEIGRVISENADDVDDFGSIETLVRSGASIDATYGIHVALETQLLMDAKFKDANRWGHTPRDHLPQSSFNKLLRKLIELGGDIQLADEWGEQPLHLAACHAAFPCHNIDSIKILIEAGADVSAKDGDGNTVADRIRAKSHEVGDDNTSGFIFTRVRENDVIPPYEVLSALMTNEQKQKHVDGWLSPRMKWMLFHVASTQIDYMVDNPSLGLSNTLQHIPAEVLRKYNSKNGHWSGYYECAKEFHHIFIEISSLLESGLTPTVDRVRTRLNGVPDYLNFTRNGGRIEDALDYILYHAKHRGHNYVDEYQSEFESLDPSFLDGMYELARFMLVNRGGGDTYRRGPYRDTTDIMDRVQGYWNY
eukprot:scaffold1117_cov187-Skeletonema_dohrnii-CCMP3373.AAC.5